MIGQQKLRVSFRNVLNFSETLETAESREPILCKPSARSITHKFTWKYSLFCNDDAFLNIYQMLRVLGTLPVITRANERFLFNLAPSQNISRLDPCLDQIYIHRSAEFNVHTVLEKFFSCISQNLLV